MQTMFLPNYLKENKRFNNENFCLESQLMRQILEYTRVREIRQCMPCRGKCIPSTNRSLFNVVIVICVEAGLID